MATTTEEEAPKRQKLSGDTLDPDQRRVVEAVKSGSNVFFTGPAGSGKSHTIATIAGTDPNVALTALTGIAAVNIGGKTIHSFAGVGLAHGTKEELMIAARSNKYMTNRWRTCRLLVIDEVSMMSDSLLEKIDWVARGCRGKMDKPFGGLQVVLVGDFLQLGAVNKDGDVKYCFQSPVWKELDLVQILLKTNHRQVDPVLRDGLAKLRVGVLDPEFDRLVSEPKVYDGPIRPTMLLPTNDEVDLINKREMSKLEDHRTYESKDYEYVRDTLKNIRGDKTLVLAVGAQVVHLTNIQPLCNGSRGVVTGFDEGLPIVQFVGLPKPVVVPLFTFEWRDRNKLLCTRLCLPLRVAFALTIHRAQGQTIDLLEVDCDRIFLPSQTYVAVSRARNLEGLYVKNLNPGKVWVDQRVEAFYAEFEEST